MEEPAGDFEAACRHVRGLAGQLPKEDLLYFYARYKQVLEGPCQVAKPAFYQLTERSKWQAWSDLGSMDRELAMEQYLDRCLGLGLGIKAEVVNV
jgi:acyl-CoA-binding protein